MGEIGRDEAAFLRAALGAARAARDFLRWMEVAAQRLSPDRSAALAAEAEAGLAPAIAGARAELDEAPPPADLAPYGQALEQAFGHVERACNLFVAHPRAAATERIAHLLAALHEVARAQEGFYGLRRAAPPFAGFWDLPGAAIDDPPARRSGDGEPATGVVHVSRGGHHGGFSLYVPESYSAERVWPVIVALHGGSGNGRDFLWTWVREARSRGYLLVTPSACESTWGPVEDQGLLEILGWLAQRYRVASDRVLLTGLSDGATFTLLYGLAHRDVYRALAPLCGVLHPANEPLGNFERARDAPIYLVHGALDFLFPVALARFARDRLVQAGARLEYRELAELSHTYPRSENTRILDWFEALPG